MDIFSKVACIYVAWPEIAKPHASLEGMAFICADNPHLLQTSASLTLGLLIVPDLFPEIQLPILALRADLSVQQLF